MDIIDKDVPLRISQEFVVCAQLDYKYMKNHFPYGDFGSGIYDRCVYHPLKWENLTIHMLGQITARGRTQKEAESLLTDALENIKKYQNSMEEFNDRLKKRKLQE